MIETSLDIPVQNTSPSRRELLRKNVVPSSPLVWLWEGCVLTYIEKLMNFIPTENMSSEIPELDYWPKNLIGSDKIQIQPGTVLSNPRKLRLVPRGERVMSLGDLYDDYRPDTNDALDKFELLLNQPIGFKRYENGLEVTKE